MRLQLVSIPTETLPLDGLYYEPDGRRPRGALLLMHGNCANFYVGPPGFLPPALTRLGLACLAYNRRGHDILATYGGREAVGGAFQLAEEAVLDNRHAAEYLRRRGFDTPIVIGHSNGGLLAIRHVADHPATPALVLLSAPGGGTQSTGLISSQGLLLRDRVAELSAEAERLVAEGRGDELLLLPGWWWVISARSLVDRLQCTPDALELAPSIRCPTLFLKGRDEPEAIYPARRFQAAAGAHCEVVELDCDHWYNGREEAVADAVTSWLERTLGP